MASEGGDPSLSGISGTDLSYSNSGTNSATQAAASSTSGDGYVLEAVGVVKTPVLGGANGPEIVPPSPLRGIGHARYNDSIVTSGTQEQRSVSVGLRTMSVKTIAEAAVQKQRGRERSPHRNRSLDARSAPSGGQLKEELLVRLRSRVDDYRQEYGLLRILPP